MTRPACMESPSGDDHTLCGDAFDLGDTEGTSHYGKPVRDAVENPVIAKPNEPIKCKDCLRIISACRRIAPWRVGE